MGNDKYDAERYRWIRGHALNPLETGAPWCVHVVTEYSMPTIKPISGKDLDDAIDKAMVKT